jgi:hypothetical protein
LTRVQWEMQLSWDWIPILGALNSTGQPWVKPGHDVGGEH